MDNLTHTLTAVLLSRTGLNRLHKRATLLLVLAANAPDVDVISLVAGWDDYMLYHRWYTHALLPMPLVAILPLLIMKLIRRKEPLDWKNAYLLSLIGVASHVALDFTNAYGVRLFLPFSDAWPRLSTVSVVDIWIWTMLLVAVAWPALSRLVSDEIGARRSRGQGLAITVLLLLTAYEATRWVLHGRAIDAQQARLISGATPRRIFAIPGPANPFHWKGVVETDSFYALHDVDLLSDDPVSESRIQYKPVANPAIEAALETRVFEVFTKFTPVYLWRTMPDSDVEGGTLVEAIDLQLGFTARALVDAQNRVVRTSVQF